MASGCSAGANEAISRVEVIRMVVVLSVQETEDLRTVRLRPVVANGPHTSFSNTGAGLETGKQPGHRTQQDEIFAGPSAVVAPKVLEDREDEHFRERELLRGYAYRAGAR